MPAEQPPAPRLTSSAPYIVGVILALGVIRLHDRRSREDRLDSLTEQRVSTSVLTTKENASD